MDKMDLSIGIEEIANSVIRFLSPDISDESASDLVHDYMGSTHLDLAFFKDIKVPDTEVGETESKTSAILKATKEYLNIETEFVVIANNKEGLSKLVSSCETEDDLIKVLELHLENLRKRHEK